MNQLKFIFVTLIVIFFTGCTTASPTGTPPVAESASTETTFPLTLTDDLGREVTIETKPQRIISLLPSNTEILFAIGAGKQVVGVTSYCNYPPEAASREQVGGITNQSISIESVVAMEPDLVVASGSQDQVIPVLEEAGLSVIVLEPATFEDIFANIELVGRATGHAAEATALTSELRSRVEAVREKVAAIPQEERPAVFYEVWNDPFMTAGPNTFIGQLIDIAGGVNIFADVDEDWPQISPEVIVSRNPDVIVGPDNHRDALATGTIVERPGWATITAVQNNRIYLLNGDAVSRSGPRIVDMLEELARDLHPGLF